MSITVPKALYISAHAPDTTMLVTKVITSLVRQAFTDAPYKNTFRNFAGIDIFSKIAAAAIIKIPVPKMKLDAIGSPKFFLKIMLIKGINLLIFLLL